MTLAKAILLLIIVSIMKIGGLAVLFISFKGCNVKMRSAYSPFLFGFLMGEITLVVTTTVWELL